MLLHVVEKMKRWQSAVVMKAVNSMRCELALPLRARKWQMAMLLSPAVKRRLQGGGAAQQVSESARERSEHDKGAQMRCRRIARRASRPNVLPTNALYAANVLSLRYREGQAFESRRQPPAAKHSFSETHCRPASR